ncbi:hypothetical protein ANANG_G00012880 [Anguilla anguilla]|uniref:Uncharacterized protein n=1 Tax=Anguilla anguilla TaxID=7936 RepID=A0A9D3S6M8_ANGAN|nr:hypothetical protein ANANG_G00012880 [Anguilla anguilla]
MRAPAHSCAEGHLAAPFEKPDHIRHRVTLRAEISQSSSLLVSITPCLVFLVLIPRCTELAMQAIRAPTISVSADCSIPAGLRMGPLPGTCTLGRYMSDRREPGLKKKVK